MSLLQWAVFTGGYILGAALAVVMAFMIALAILTSRRDDPSRIRRDL